MQDANASKNYAHKFKTNQAKLTQQKKIKKKYIKILTMFFLSHSFVKQM